MYSNPASATPLTAATGEGGIYLLCHSGMSLVGGDAFAIVAVVMGDGVGVIVGDRFTAATESSKVALAASPGVTFRETVLEPAAG